MLKFKNLALSLLLVFPLIFSFTATPEAASVTLTQVKVLMYQISVTDNHGESCDEVTWYWGVRWQRIYGNYWDEFYSDSAYTSSGEWDSFAFGSSGSFKDSRSYTGTHTDNEYSPYVYTKDNRIYLFAAIKIEKDPAGWWASCGDTSEATAIAHYVTITAQDQLYSITISVYGGMSTFYFKLKWY